MSPAENELLVRLLERTARIEQKLDDRPCRVHSERLTALERTVGKQNYIAAVLGAIGTGIVFAIKYLAGTSGKG